MEPFSLPPGFTHRPANMDDLEACVALFNTCSQVLEGVSVYTLADYRQEWQTPGFCLESDTRVINAPNGKIVAYHEVWDLGSPHVQVHSWGRVHPEYSGLGLGSALLDWAEARARQAVPLAPEGAEVILTSFILARNSPAIELYQAAGFERVRESLRMIIAMEAPPPEPQWPEGITLRTIRVGVDERAVVEADLEAFQDHWGFVAHPVESELARLQHFIAHEESFDASLWFLAVDTRGEAGEQVAGLCLCRPWVHDDRSLAWVGTLAVRRPWRRQGLGLALLRHSFGEFYRRGNRRVGLGVDAQNLTGATRLYLKAGMHPDVQHQYTILQKVLQ